MSVFVQQKHNFQCVIFAEVFGTPRLHGCQAELMKKYGSHRSGELHSYNSGHSAILYATTMILILLNSILIERIVVMKKYIDLINKYTIQSFAQVLEIFI